MRWKSALSLAAAAALVIGIASCSSDSTETGSEIIPGKTLEDWRVYGDHLVLATLTDEERLPLTPEEEERGEGLVGRSVTFEIDQVLWSREEAPASPATVTTGYGGWQVKDGKESPFTLGGPTLTQGDEYVMVLTELRAVAEPEEDSWTPLSVESIFPASDGRFAKGSEFNGKPITYLAERLEAMPIPDEALPHMSKPPVKRWNAIARDARKKAEASAD